MTIKEQIVFALESRRVLRAYEEYEDLPEDAEILAYSLNEIAAEKVVALLDEAKSAPTLYGKTLGTRALIMS